MNFFAKKFGGLEKSLYLCSVFNDKQQKEKKMKDEKIFIKRSEVKRLASIFGVSEVFVYMSLRYDRDSELAKKIRHTALKSKADGGCGGEVWKRIK